MYYMFTIVTITVFLVQRKCDQYWPENGETKQYHDIYVQHLDTETTSDFIIRSFDLTKV